MSQLPSTRPYMLRAIHQWCEDNGFTPYLAVSVDASVQVPRQHVVNGEIVLNISSAATSGLMLGNDSVTFKARFGGVPQSVLVPVGRVVAIYARENGQGMAFPVESPVEPAMPSPGAQSVDENAAPDAALHAKGGSRPTLTRIK